MLTSQKRQCVFIAILVSHCLPLFAQLAAGPAAFAADDECLAEHVSDAACGLSATQLRARMKAAGEASTSVGSTIVGSSTLNPMAVVSLGSDSVGLANRVMDLATEIIDDEGKHGPKIIVGIINDTPQPVRLEHLDRIYGTFSEHVAVGTTLKSNQMVTFGMYNKVWAILGARVGGTMMVKRLDGTNRYWSIAFANNIRITTTFTRCSPLQVYGMGMISETEAWKKMCDTTPPGVEAKKKDQIVVHLSMLP